MKGTRLGAVSVSNRHNRAQVCKDLSTCHPGAIPMVEPNRQTQTIAGIVFLGLMLLFLVLAITTFPGQSPTTLLVIASLVCLGVGLFFLSSNGPGSAASDAWADGQSQQQSVVLADGGVIRQSSHPGLQAAGGQRAPQGYAPTAYTQAPPQVLVVCPSCSKRIPEAFAHCSHCGAKQ